MYRRSARGSRMTWASAPDATVDAEIHEINGRQILRSQNLSLVCDVCDDEAESVAAVVKLLSRPPRHYTLCGLCYREFRNLALGIVT